MESLPDTPRYVAYERISRDPYLTSESIDRQYADNEKLAERLGWTPIEHLVDRNRSAWKKRGSRPGFNELVRRIREREVDGVIVWNIDRLLRRNDELEELISAIEGAQIPIQTATSGDFDLNTSDGRFIARLLVSGAARESDNTSRRLKRAFQDLSEESRRRRAPAYGDNPANRQHLLWMAQEFVAGKPISTIRTELEDMGAPVAQTAKKWTYQSIKTILSTKRNRDYLPPELAEAVERELAARKRTRVNPTVHYPLSNILHCGRCGAPMWGEKNTAAGRRYACSNKIGRDACRMSVGPAEAVEQAVLDAIVELTEGYEFDEVVEREVLPAEYARRIEELEEDYYIGRLMNRERFQAIRAQLETEAAQAAEHLKTRTRPVPVGKRFLAEWETGTPATRVMLLRRAVDHITVAPRVKGQRAGFDPARLTVVLHGKAAPQR